MKIDPYYQRRKCSADTTETVRTCEGIRLMPIFVGVCWIWIMASNEKIAIFASCGPSGRYIFLKFIYKTKSITSEYAVLQWLFIDIETDDLE